MVYRRKANLIRKLLEKWKIGELAANSKILFDLTYALKNQGYRVIRHAIYQIKKYVDENSRFPSNVIRFIEEVIRTKTQNLIMSTAIKTGIADFIAPLQENLNRRYREFDFASTLSRYRPGIMQLEKLFKQVKSDLVNIYGRRQ